MKLYTIVIFLILDFLSAWYTSMRSINSRRTAASGSFISDAHSQAAGLPAYKGTWKRVYPSGDEIVHKDIAGFFSRQLMAEIIHQQSAAGGIRGAGIVPQEVKTCPSKSVLYAFQKNSKVIGIYTDANDM